MTFLPVVERELRAAARRRGTYRLRSWTALAAILVSMLSLVMLALGRRSSLGSALFATLTGYAFGLSLLAGIFLTADSIAEEKREGTLGLLFLTDLNGYDVVLGKFTAMLCNALYVLLALLPIIAISMLLGGVTGGEFWRKALALINGLFVSLAAGIWVSTLAFDAQRAMGSVLGILLLLVAAPPLLAGSGLLVGQAFAWVKSLSPLTPFTAAAAVLYLNHALEFWVSLAASNLVGWLFLAMASNTLPRHWQEQANPEHWPGILTRFFRSRPRQARQRDLLALNPILWLVSGQSGFNRPAWLIVLAWVALVLILTLASPTDITFIVSSSAARPFGFLLKALFAAQACRFFAESRRNGALELLLSTPLTNRDIIRGQGRSLWRTFRWPVCLFLASLFVPVAANILSGVRSLDFSQILGGGFGLLATALTAIRALADFFALFWFGLWLGLTVKRPPLAASLTILLVLILPSFLCILDLLADLFFILYGATKLQQDLRWVLAQQQNVNSPPAGTFPTQRGLPPVIAPTR